MTSYCRDKQKDRCGCTGDNKDFNILQRWQKMASAEPRQTRRIHPLVSLTWNSVKVGYYRVWNTWQGKWGGRVGNWTSHFRPSCTEIQMGSVLPLPLTLPPKVKYLNHVVLLHEQEGLRRYIVWSNIILKKITRCHQPQCGKTEYVCTHTYVLTLFWKKEAWKCAVVADIDIKLISSELGLCK